MKTKTISLCFILSMLFSGFTYAEMTEDVIKLQKRWAQIKYEIPQDQHKNEFDKLLVEAETILQKNKAKTLEDIYQNAQYILNDYLQISPEDLKLLDDPSRNILKNFLTQYEKTSIISKESLEKIINNFINIDFILLLIIC